MTTSHLAIALSAAVPLHIEELKKRGGPTGRVRASIDELRGKLAEMEAWPVQGALL